MRHSTCQMTTQILASYCYSNEYVKFDVRDTIPWQTQREACELSCLQLCPFWHILHASYRLISESVTFPLSLLLLAPVASSHLQEGDSELCSQGKCSFRSHLGCLETSISNLVPESFGVETMLSKCVDINCVGI